MSGMKTPTKRWLLVIALALLACLAVLVSRPDAPVAPSVPDTSGGPSFEVRVLRPRLARPLFGIIPTRLEEKLWGNRDPWFDHTSRGAEVGIVRHDRLELRADGWDFIIESDGEGRVARGTRLVFPMELAERQRRLRCRPAERATGYLSITARAGSDLLDGHFLVELASCKNDESGKDIEWPPAPLTVRGSFAGLPHDRR
jgi:hypothetical protein